MQRLVLLITVKGSMPFCRSAGRNGRTSRVHVSSNFDGVSECGSLAGYEDMFSIARYVGVCGEVDVLFSAQIISV